MGTDQLLQRKAVELFPFSELVTSLPLEKIVIKSHNNNLESCNNYAPVICNSRPHTIRGACLSGSVGCMFDW